jgi:hypothetical protein
MVFMHTILPNLISQEKYRQKVLPHLKDQYFTDPVQKMDVQGISTFLEQVPRQTTNQGYVAARLERTIRYW